MSAEYDAGLEVASAVQQVEQSLDLMYMRMPTLRERAALAAMQGLLAAPWEENDWTPDTAEGVAMQAVEMADALLAELAKKQP